MSTCQYRVVAKKIILCVKLFIACNNYIFIFTLYSINSYKKTCVYDHTGGLGVGWDVSRLIVRYDVIHATKAKMST